MRSCKNYTPIENSQYSLTKILLFCTRCAAPSRYLRSPVRKASMIYNGRHLEHGIFYPYTKPCPSNLLVASIAKKAKQSLFATKHLLALLMVFSPYHLSSLSPQADQINLWICRFKIASGTFSFCSHSIKVAAGKETDPTTGENAKFTCDPRFRI